MRPTTRVPVRLLIIHPHIIDLLPKVTTYRKQTPSGIITVHMGQKKMEKRSILKFSLGG